LISIRKGNQLVETQKLRGVCRLGRVGPRLKRTATDHNIKIVSFLISCTDIAIVRPNGTCHNTLTPAVPTSVVIKLVASVPASTNFNVCNPSTLDLNPAHFTQVGVPNNAGAGTGPGWLTNGMIAWGTTLEPDSPTGTYGVVNVPYQKEPLSTSELTALTTICNFIQTNGTGYGICKSCQTGALSGAKN